MVKEYLKSFNKLDYQKLLLNLITDAFNLLTGNGVEISDIKCDNDEKEKFICILRESISGYIVNNLINLIGNNNKTPQLSIYKKDNVLLNKFIADNQEQYNELKLWRDKYYAHFDMNLFDCAKTLNQEFIKKCIDFLNNYFEKINDVL